MKRILTWTVLALLLVGCGSEQKQPEEPSALEQEMTAIYGENRVIEEAYPDSLAVEVACIVESRQSYYK